jgi:hypothetical protein
LTAGQHSGQYSVTLTTCQGRSGELDAAIQTFEAQYGTSGNTPPRKKREWTKAQKEHASMVAKQREAAKADKAPRTKAKTMTAAG